MILINVLYAIWIEVVVQWSQVVVQVLTQILVQVVDLVASLHVVVDHLLWIDQEHTYFYVHCEDDISIERYRNVHSISIIKCNLKLIIIIINLEVFDWCECFNGSTYEILQSTSEQYTDVHKYEPLKHSLQNNIRFQLVVVLIHLLEHLFDMSFDIEQTKIYSSLNLSCVYTNLIT